jgi:uncharacterized repeat protein (TIGR02543 family)
MSSKTKSLQESTHSIRYQMISTKYNALFLAVIVVMTIMAGACKKGNKDEPSVEKKFVTLKFNMMGGAPIDSLIVLSGVPSPELTKVKINKIGYTFDGWSTDNTLLSTFDPTKAITGNMTLYARWKDNFTGTKTEIIKSLDNWLKTAPFPRTIGTQLFSKTPLSKDDATAARELVVRDGSNQILQKYAKAWNDKVFSNGKQLMKFEYRVLNGNNGGKGPSLYISLHGGGGTTKDVNDQQWRNQINLYSPSEGIYLAPRAPEDLFNMWHVPYMDDFYDALIQTAVVMAGVNPNRIYLTGYSAGGDGVYQMAPRMADRWAAAAMMAGHPGDASAMNLRNIGFTLWVGALDTDYNRAGLAAKWGVTLDGLSAAYPGEYAHFVNVVPNKPHWMDGEDAATIPWMAKFIRNPLPPKISWRQDDVKHSSFYWITVDGAITGNPELIIERNGNNFNIIKSNYTTFNIGVNDDMINFDQNVKVTYNGNTLFDSKVNRNIESIYNSMNLRYDINLVFSSSIKVTIP